MLGIYSVTISFLCAFACISSFACSSVLSTVAGEEEEEGEKEGGGGDFCTITRDANPLKQLGLNPLKQHELS